MALKIEIKDYDTDTSKVIFKVIEVSYSLNSIKFIHVDKSESNIFIPINCDIIISNNYNNKNYIIDTINYKG